MCESSPEAFQYINVKSCQSVFQMRYNYNYKDKPPTYMYTVYEQLLAEHTVAYRSRLTALSVSFRVTVTVSLPDNVVTAKSVDSFKSRLDKFWNDQEVKLVNVQFSVTNSTSYLQQRLCT